MAELRALLKLIQGNPLHGLNAQLREAITNLSEPAIGYLNDRLRRWADTERWKRRRRAMRIKRVDKTPKDDALGADLVRRTSGKQPLPDPWNPGWARRILMRGGLLEWAKTAQTRALVSVLDALIEEGISQVPGRRRGPDKRSASTIEPIIMGIQPGPSAGRGGRPTHRALDDLVARLGYAWLYATEQQPELGRSDGKGFGDLVHKVFSWVGEESSATQALRRYSDVIRSMEVTELPDGTVEYR